MKTYTGTHGRAKQYDGSKKELCEAWKNPMIKWLKRKERQEAKASIRNQLAEVL